MAEYTYINPWHCRGYGPEMYTARSRPIHHRGFRIFHRFEGWDVVAPDNRCIAQYAGKAGAKMIIDKILDNPTDYWAARAIGFMAT